MFMNNHQKGTHEQWASKLGFILAAMGSAVGLGNIWRFSYVVGENGGGAFLLIYIACVVFIGLPIIMAEFVIGRRAQGDAVSSFQKIAPGKAWQSAGFMGLASAFIILSFYGVVAGWTLKYFFSYLTGGLALAPAETYTDYFVKFITNPSAPLMWQAVFMGLTIAIVLGGVKKGIEVANKILMPTLALLVVGMAVYSLSLGGAQQALQYLFRPDWSVLSEPSVYLAALGQAFFSLSLGMGALITYGGYLSKKEKLPGAALSVTILDTLFAIVSGLVIFPAVFAFGANPGDGPGLVFFTLPGIFERMPAGFLIAPLFFFLLAMAALTSAVSLLEVPTAYFINKYGWDRKKTAVLLGIIIFLLGIPSSLGQGTLSHIRPILGRDILDSFDFIASNVLLPLGGLIIALFVGWGWKRAEAFAESDLGESALGKAWLFILRYVAPIAITAVFLVSIGVIKVKS